MKENRAVERCPLPVHVFFFWRDTRGKRHWGTGTARELSCEGIFVMSMNCPPVKTQVRLDLSLPALSDHARRIRIESQGRVLRVENKGNAPEGRGFAALNETFRLWDLV
jgi:hypothetical protein